MNPLQGKSNFLQYNIHFFSVLPVEPIFLLALREYSTKLAFYRYQGRLNALKIENIVQKCLFAPPLDRKRGGAKTGWSNLDAPGVGPLPLPKNAPFSLFLSLFGLLYFHFSIPFCPFCFLSKIFTLVISLYFLLPRRRY